MKLLLIVFAILLVSEVDARSTKSKPRSQDKKKRAKKESKEEPEAKEKQTTPDPPVAPPAE
jgi:Na+-transporting methylmalonyl-CoA/oxaloacetate decarboxylase gamma subunit